MPRPKGLPKTGGRKPGTPNKKKQILQEILSDLNFNPIEKILEIFPKQKPEQKIDVCLSLLPYLYPKRKAVDISLERPDPTEELSEDEMLKEINSINKRLGYYNAEDLMQMSENEIMQVFDRADYRKKLKEARSKFTEKKQLK